MYPAEFSRPAAVRRLRLSPRHLVYGVAFLAIAGTAASAWFEAWEWTALPAVGLAVSLALVDFRRLYYLLIATLPLSTEVELPGGLGTDLPSEPLMWVLTLTAVAWFVRHGRTVSSRFLRHPIALALLAHLAWMTLACLTTTFGVVSLKFWLAKGWYVIVFFFLAGYLFREERDVRALLWWFFIPLLATVCIVLVRHAERGFSFEQVNYVLGPFYRNHVMYACIQAVFLPFVWLGLRRYRRYSGAWWGLAIGAVILLAGINFAYTRAAYAGLFAIVGLYWIVRWRLLRATLVAFAIGVASFIAFVVRRDNWLLFAPNYERTVTHTRFDNLLEATVRLEDISLMERVYRWVAAAYMLQEHPWMGIGPGTFYFNYQNYTVSSFKTYVSHNPERSGIHNGFLMVAVEQGVPGFVLFIAFCSLVLLWGQRAYHRLRDPAWGAITMAALLSFALICLLMLMNDFAETDKIGSLFFICAALILNASLRAEDERKQPTDKGPR